MSEKAFPLNSPDGLESNEGMDLRDYLAAKAMQGIISNTITALGKNHIENNLNLATIAYCIADAMMEVRKNGK